MVPTVIAIYKMLDWALVARRKRHGARAFGFGLRQKRLALGEINVWTSELRNIRKTRLVPRAGIEPARPLPAKGF